MEYLLCYRWPGNVRELQNEIRGMVAVADTDSRLDASALRPAIRKDTGDAMKLRHPHELVVPLTDKLGPTQARIEREMIRRALRTHAHVDAAARALGISRKGLYLKRRRLGL
jgi:transcriptional regulator with PAS, ATPase and Fis domain